jgi:hypothetical protein
MKSEERGPALSLYGGTRPCRRPYWPASGYGPGAGETQTVLVSTRTVEKTGKHPADLRNMVTSPRGTTTRALLELRKGRLRSLLPEAAGAAHRKAKNIQEFSTVDLPFEDAV